jgi:PDZ domain
VAKSASRRLPFDNATVTALTWLAHDASIYFRRIAASRLGGQRQLWQFCLSVGEIWVSLSALAVLTLLFTGGAYANDIYHPRLHSLNDYLAGQISEQAILEDWLLGLTLREDRRNLKSGGSAPGLLIVAVRERSPAAIAGLIALRKAPREILSGIIAVGSVAFPPAIMLLPIVNSLPLELGGDLIIAADGWRVRNELDYQNEISDTQPGEIVYLTIVRKGVRKQVLVRVPALGS